MFLQKVLELKHTKLRRITHRDMSPFMVDMDKSSFHIGKNLYLVLQFLADVVCLPEWGVAVHYDVNFHKVILQGSVGKYHLTPLIDTHRSTLQSQILV